MGCSSEVRLLCVQAHDKRIEEDMEAYLLESWPEDPGEAGLGSAFKGLGPLFSNVKFADGTMIASSGDCISEIFYIEHGEVVVTYPEEPDVDSLSDDDEVCPSFRNSTLLRFRQSPHIYPKNCFSRICDLRPSLATSHPP